MRILLIGATGQLGSDLIKNNPGHEILAPLKSQLDVTRNDRIAAVMKIAARLGHQYFRISQRAFVRRRAGESFSYKLRRDQGFGTSLRDTRRAPDDLQHGLRI